MVNRNANKHQDRANRFRTSNVLTTTERELLAFEFADVEAQCDAEHEEIVRSIETTAYRQLEANNTRLEDEIKRFRPVIDAALRWHETHIVAEDNAEDALTEACEKYIRVLATLLCEDCGKNKCDPTLAPMHVCRTCFDSACAALPRK